MTVCGKCVRWFFFFLVVCVALLLFVSLIIPPSYLVYDEIRDDEDSFVGVDKFAGTNITIVPLKSASQSKQALNVLGNQTGTSWGYLLVVDYEQQLMGGFMAFYHLANITSMLNLSSVEPYVRKTGLEGAPLIDMGSDAQALKLSSFYDLDQLRGLVKSCCGGNHLVTFETFMESASRDVVLVAFLYSLKYHEKYFPDGRKVVEIDSGTESLLSGLNNLNKWTLFVARQRNWQSAHFRVSRVILVDARPQHALPLSLLIEKLGTVVSEQVVEFGSATVILDSFRDIQVTYQSLFFSMVPGFDWKNCLEMDTIKHSQKILDTAKKFAHDLNQAHPVVGVYIRIERLLTDLKARVALYMNCLRQLKRLFLSGTIANLTRGSVYIFHDVGKYGTKGCIYKSFCYRGRPHFLSLIERMGFDVVSFDPESFHPAALRGAFSAYVEMEYLSNVDDLVVIGHGEFQNHIIQRYLKNHGGSKDHLHRICYYPPVNLECYPHC